MKISTLQAVLILILWGCVLTVGVGVYGVYANPQKIIRFVMHKTQMDQMDRHGLSFSVGSITPLLWPAPGLRVESVMLRTQNGDAVHMNACEINLDWTQLLTGQLKPGTVTLHAPSIILHLPKATAHNPEPADITGPPAPFSPGQWLEPHLHSLFVTVDAWNVPGLSVRVRNGQATVFAAQESAPDSGQPLFTLGGVQGRMRFPGLLDSLLELRVAKGVFSTPAGQLSVTDAALELDSVQVAVRRGRQVPISGTIDASATFDLPDVASNLTLNTHAQWREQQHIVLEGKSRVAGDLLLAKQRIPVELTLPFASQNISEALRLTNGQVRFENDAASFSATLTPPQKATPLTLQGTVNVERLSLTRWFGFARDLPPGIQNALNTLSGSLDFQLDPQQLRVPRLAATALGMTFTGKGGVERFDRPVISIDATTAHLDANLVFPELLGRTSPTLTFPGPVLVECDLSTPFDENDPGFAIHLSADRANFWKWDSQGLALSITPLTASGGVKLGLSTKNFYGGAVQGALGIDDAFALTLQADNVNAEQPVTRVAGFAAWGGVLTLRANLKSRGKSLDTLLAALKGTVQATVSNGFMDTTAKDKAGRWPFARLDISFSGQGQPLSGKAISLPPEQVYTGDWRMAVKSPEVSGEGTLRGPMRFSTTNWLPAGASQLECTGSGLVQQTDVRGTGKLSFNIRQGTLELEKFSGTLMEGPASGFVRGLGLGNGKPQWEGRLQINTKALRPFLSKQGVNVTRLPTKALQSLQLAGDFIISDALTRFTGLNGKLDDTTLSGSLSREVNSASSRLPAWTVDLQLGDLDLQRYLPESGTTPAPPTVYPVQDLKTFTLDGLLRAASLTLAGLRHEQVRVPLRVEGGVASLLPITANLGGGAVNASARVEATSSGALTHMRYKATDVDMLGVSKRRRQDTLLAGKGGFDAEVRALVRASSDIPAAFNGQWNFAVRNGYLVSAEHEGDRTARRSFTSMLASGKLENGIIRNDNLVISGGAFSAHGKGEVNLVNWTLDYRLNAALPGVPNIPIHFYGSLDKPQSDVNALKAIGGAIGNLGQNVFDLLGDVITAPFRLLNK